MSSVSMIDGHIDREEKTFTDKEIIEGLKCHSNKNNSCEDCAFWGEGCSLELCKAALELINCQQAEIEQYKASVLNDTEYLERLEVENRKQQAEIERLENHNKEVTENCLIVMNRAEEHYNTLFEEAKEILINKAKSEAIKEFADLVDKDINEKLSDSIKEQNPHLYLIHQIVKDRLKEMVGDGVTECQKKTRYIVVHENWLFESYLCESCFGWDVYQFEKTENDYKLRLHMLAEEPVATVEDAKKYVERWRTQVIMGSLLLI